MHSLFSESTATLREHLDTYISRDCRSLLALQPWGPDFRVRLREYALRGKLIRGALVPVAFRLFQSDRETPDVAYQAGVAMELLQSFLLIHDDIMDQDSIRRGGPAVHSQYESILADQENARQFGLSMGICGGDVAAFLAMERISTLPVDPVLRADLVTLVSKEIISVGLAQMQDVHHGYISEVTTEDILHVYTYKTGRYTFSLPLMTGARLAGVPAAQEHILARIGEHLGRIFQIRDDQLGLFGRSEEIGKTAGSDIRENKKTLFRESLLQRLPEDHPARFVFGSADLDPQQIQMVQDEIVRTGVLDEVNRLVEDEQRRIMQLMDELEIPDAGREVLNALVNYNNRRTM